MPIYQTNISFTLYAADSIREEQDSDIALDLLTEAIQPSCSFEV